jgi:hypothetical protein
MTWSWLDTCSKCTSSSCSVPAVLRNPPKLNLEKCQFCQKEVWYLGHITSPEGITSNPKKLTAIQEWLIPKNKHKIKSFPGLCMHYRQFISGFTNTMKPLTKLTQEKQAFQWTLEHFHKYLYGQEFHLHTDHTALTWLMSFRNLEGQTRHKI